MLEKILPRSSESVSISSEDVISTNIRQYSTGSRTEFASSVRHAVSYTLHHPRDITIQSDRQTTQQIVKQPSHVT